MKTGKVTIKFKDGPYLKTKDNKRIFIGSLDIRLIDNFVNNLKELPQLQKCPEKKERGKGFWM